MWGRRGLQMTAPVPALQSTFLHQNQWHLPVPAKFLHNPRHDFPLDNSRRVFDLSPSSTISNKRSHGRHYRKLPLRKAASKDDTSRSQRAGQTTSPTSSASRSPRTRHPLPNWRRLPRARANAIYRELARPCFQAAGPGDTGLWRACIPSPRIARCEGTSIYPHSSASHVSAC